MHHQYQQLHQRLLLQLPDQHDVLLQWYLKNHIDRIFAGGFDAGHVYTPIPPDVAQVSAAAVRAAAAAARLLRHGLRPPPLELPQLEAGESPEREEPHIRAQVRLEGLPSPEAQVEAPAARVRRRGSQTADRGRPDPSLRTLSRRWRTAGAVGRLLTQP